MTTEIRLTRRCYSCLKGCTSIAIAANKQRARKRFLKGVFGGFKAKTHEDWQTSKLDRAWGRSSAQSWSRVTFRQDSGRTMVLGGSARLRVTVPLKASPSWNRRNWVTSGI